MKEVPLSPSPSPLWFLQQQLHGDEDQRDAPPAGGRGEERRQEKKKGMRRREKGDRASQMARTPNC